MENLIAYVDTFESGLVIDKRIEKPKPNKWEVDNKRPLGCNSLEEANALFGSCFFIYSFVMTQCSSFCLLTWF